MSQPFLGEIKMFAGNFAPRGYAFCNGQLLPIAQNTALFSILGTTYGGNGQTTFALPDLRGRVPIHWQQGNGLTNRSLGEIAGEENHTLTNNEMPLHTHTVGATDNEATSNRPVGKVPARGAAYAGTASGGLGGIGTAGGSQAHNNMQPYLAVSFIIALQGIFPSRN